MEIIVFGAGSLGSLLGGLLARTHHVTLVGRNPHVQTVREDGLYVSGECEFAVRPDARTDPPASADLALVTVKSFDTDDAGRALRDVELDAVLSLQNGMGNEERLATHLTYPVLAGTCTYGAILERPGYVTCTGIGDVVLGPRDGGSSARATEIGKAFRDSGVETEVATDMPRRLWEKLAVNAGINATTALARIENGALADGPGGETARDAARETARVAREQGNDISDNAATTALNRVVGATASNTSSMQQDILAGDRTEIDAINGYVVKIATEPVSVNQTLTNLVRAWERNRGLR